MKLFKRQPTNHILSDTIRDMQEQISVCDERIAWLMDQEAHIAEQLRQHRAVRAALGETHLSLKLTTEMSIDFLTRE